MISGVHFCGRWLLVAFVFGLGSCRHERQLVRVTGPTMGTTWAFQAVAPPSDVQTIIQSHLDAREAVFSHWRKDSSLSRFNESASTDWASVPLELVHVVAAAKRIADQTDGALDITVAPLVELWGFGGSAANGNKRRVPSRPEIDAALQHCGWRHLQWREDPPALRKDAPQVRINVAAVTEGFVMDELVTILRSRGMTDFLLEVGGEVYAAGRAPSGQAWQVGIQTPDAPTGDVMDGVPLENACLSTSGSYRHRFSADGQTFSHLIDPRTGSAITHALLSVSVADQSCQRADGFATALMVLGPERGRQVAERLGLRVFWVEGESR
jgi:thiamine biosynthesis lipoprotein